MKIYIVALMAFLNGQTDGFEPPMAFVFTQPTFSTVYECKNYAVANSTTLLLKLYEEFGQNYRPHMISCVDENVVEQIQQNNVFEEREEFET